uniref:Uncharacterized protein n=1 Tax=Anopheles atroparvus TaxID=41427 RepID=A0AAG5CN88_ANOAO
MYPDNYNISDYETSGNANRTSPIFSIDPDFITQCSKNRHVDSKTPTKSKSEPISKGHLSRTAKSSIAHRYSRRNSTFIEDFLIDRTFDSTETWVPVQGIYVLVTPPVVDKHLWKTQTLFLGQ